MSVERIQPQGLTHPSSPPSFTHVVKAGNTVYIAGQVARDAQGRLIGLGDIDAQIGQVFENIKTALGSVGADFGSLVKLTIYLTDARFRNNFREVSARYLRADLPSSTLLIVAGLAQPEYLIEIDAIAVVI